MEVSSFNSDVLIRTKIT